MTNEEKAREIADSLKGYALMSDYGKSLRAAKEMAAWKEQQMIEKAVKWMRSRQKGFINKIVTITEKDIQDFKKAMEGEEE